MAADVQNGKALCIKEAELFAFPSINFFMGYVSLPSWRDYWSTINYLGQPFLSNAMPRKHFDNIRCNLFINDNLARPRDCKDKFYKICPLIDIANKQF